MNTNTHITLCQLQQLVRQSIETALPLPVWVSAEVSDIKVNRSGHCYLELIEKGETPACVASCMMRALKFGPIDELKALYGDAVTALPCLERM